MGYNKLAHAGTKGMKWYVRRYQNYDGTLTEAGKRRYNRATRDMSDKKKAKYEPDIEKWVDDDIRSTRRLTDESKNLTDQLKNANDKSIRNAPKAKLDLSNMTDQQMRSEINRALLERQYNDMFAPQKSTRGREIVNSVLESAGTVLGIAGTALGIALAIRDLRG
jgi:hypothetical protein